MALFPGLALVRSPKSCGDELSYCHTMTTRRYESLDRPRRRGFPRKLEGMLRLSLKDRPGLSESATIGTDTTTSQSSVEQEVHRSAESPISQDEQSVRSVPIDVDSLQEYHDDEETIQTTEDHNIGSGRVELQFERGWQPQHAAIEEEPDYPVDVDTLAFVPLDYEEELSVRFFETYSEETDMMRGLTSYAEGFEAPVVTDASEDYALAFDSPSPRRKAPHYPPSIPEEAYEV